MPKTGDLNNPITPGGTPPPPSWAGKKVNRKPEFYDAIWQVLADAFPHFNCTYDNQVHIKIEGFGETLFVRAEFYLVP